MDYSIEIERKAVPTMNEFALPLSCTTNQRNIFALLSVSIKYDFIFPVCLSRRVDGI
jgi:hypothetical protein